MKPTHFALLVGWTLLVVVAVGALLFLFTYGDCVGDSACGNAASRNMAIILGGGFVTYWTVFVLFVRRWSR